MFPLKWYRRSFEPNPISELSLSLSLSLEPGDEFGLIILTTVVWDTFVCRRWNDPSFWWFHIFSLISPFSFQFLFVYSSVYCAEHYEDCICPTKSWLDYITSYSFWMLVRHSFSFSIVISFLLKIENGTMRIKFVVVFMRLNISDIKSLVLFILSASVFRFSFRFRSLF